ncbi:MAG: DUF4153 domain-containing protein, partial [Flavobacteriaceae bacterium]|nr:DUF4153 domain-containing protein [Flavobacteriaceae bacterium]
MKLPSLDYLFNKSKESFLRFPLTILSSIVAACIGIYMVEFEDEIKNFFPYINLLLTAALGIPLYFFVSISITKYKFNSNLKLVSIIGSTILLVIIYFSLPNSNITHNTSVPYIRYGIFNIIVHLLVSFIPYVKSKSLNGFWNYNKILFIRILTSALYSGVLFVGIVLALYTLETLFYITIHDELYFQCFIFIIGFFNTWFFVSGIPKDLDALENIRDYPAGLKTFTQYILLPLLVVYLIILYAYGTKIVLNLDWPKGIVSYLISCVSILGILTLLLIHPYGNLKENSWIKKFTSIYYYILFPLIIILFIAIWIRIDDYGLTINRYLIVLLGVWLSIICFYFSMGRSNIKFIPISLSIILILMSFGPWSMFSISEKSQANRLHKILEENAILKKGRIHNEVLWETDSLPKLYSKEENTNELLLNDSIHNEVKSILDYLDDYHGFSKIKPLFQQNMDSLTEIIIGKDKFLTEANVFMRTLGLKYVHKYSYAISNSWTYSSKHNKVVSISNYDYFLDFNRYNNDRNKLISFKIKGVEYTLAFIDQDLRFTSENDTIIFKLNSLVDALENEFGNNNQSDIAEEKMTLKASSSIFDMKIILSSIRKQEVNDTIVLNYINGRLFLK